MTLKLLLNGLFNAIWRVFAFLLILFAVYIALGRQLIPNIPSYRLELAGYVSQALGADIHINEIEGEWIGFGPSITARGIQAGPELNIGEVRLDISVLASIARGRLVANYLEIKNARAELVERASDGSWLLGDLVFQRNQAQPTELTVDDVVTRLVPLLDHDVVAVRDLEFDLVINQLPKLNVRINDGQVRGEFSDKNLSLDLTVTSDEQIAGVELLANIDDWGSPLTARLYLHQEAFDWGPWLARLELPVTIQQFLSNSTFWFDFEKGQVRHIRSRINVPNIQLAQENKTLAFNDVATELSVEHFEGAWQVWLKDLQFKFLDQVWQPSLHQLHWSHSGVELLSNQLDFQLLTNLANLIQPTDILKDLNPRGQLLNSRIFWQNAALPEHKLNIQGRFENVGVSSWQGMPGLENVAGFIDMSPGFGKITLQKSEVTMELPGMFPEPLEMADLTGGLSWQWRPEAGLFLRSTTLTASHPGIDKLNARFSLVSPPKAQWQTREPRIDLQLDFSQAKFEYLEKFVPFVIDPHARQWALDNIKYVEVPFGMVQVSSPTIKAADIAASNLVYIKTKKGHLQFLPEWPAANDMNGLVTFDKNGVQAFIKSADFYDLDLSNLWVRLGTQKQAPVQLKTFAQGDTGQVLDLVRQTPLRSMVDDTLDKWVADGPAQGKVDLVIPLNDAPVSADVTLSLVDSRLVMPEYELALTGLKGDIKYNDELQLHADEVWAEFFGRTTRIALATHERPADGLHFLVSAEGRIPLKDLGTWLDDPLIHQQAGVTPYQARLDVGETTTTLDVTTDLRGLGLDFTYPLNKSAEDRWPTKLHMEFGADKTLLTAKVDHPEPDRQFSAAFELSPENHILRGQILNEEGAQLPEEDGIFMAFNLSETDGDFWYDDIERIEKLYNQWQAKPNPNPGPDFDELIKEVLVNAKTLVFMDEPWSNAEMVITRNQEGWAAVFKADQVQGSLGYGHGENDPLIVDIDFVNVSYEETEEASESEEEVDLLAEVNPKEFPPAIVQIRRFNLNDKDMGGWSFQIEPQADGARFTEIQGIIRGVETTGVVEWSLLNGAHSTYVNGVARTGDIGRVLELWGYAKNAQSESGKIELALSWPGSPLAFDMRKADGRLDLDIRNGSVLALEEYEGIKVFGIFNFSRILKRLALDFSDVVREGISFDAVQGELLFDDGFAMIGRKMEVDGAATKFKFDGGYDMVNEQLDFDMVFTVPLSSALPLAALLAGVTPQVAVAIYVSEKVLNTELEKFSSVRYRITGDWDDPKYELYKAFSNTLD